MATTTNYSWTTPDDTDLVKDGAAAIRTLGSSADTTVKDLNPGTTAGDIDYYTSSTAKARIAIGTAGQVLQVNAGATAPEWVTSSSGAYTSLASGSLSSGAVNLTGIVGTFRDLVWVLNDIQVTAACDLLFRVNSNSGSNYRGVSIRNISGTPNLENNSTYTSVPVSAGNSYGTGDNDNAVIIRLYDYANTTNYKLMTHIECYENSTGQQWEVDYRGSWNQTTAINEVNIIASGTTFAGGTYNLFGVK
jgi:hypothetical protein